MDDTVDGWVFREDIFESLLIGDVDTVGLWLLSTDEFDSVEGFQGSIVKVIDDNDLVVCFEEGKRCE